MFRRTLAFAATGVLVLCAHAEADGVAAPVRAPDPQKTQAERNILAFLQQEQGRRWILRHRGGRALYPRLYDARTGLLRDNTQVRCVRSRNPDRRGRFFCVVRPARHRPREALHIRYIHYRKGNYFRIRWMFYRSG
jgi:hypothetical protein